MLEEEQGDTLRSLMAVPLAGQVRPAIKQYLERGALAVLGAKQGSFNMEPMVVTPGGGSSCAALHCTARRCTALHCTALD